MRVALWQDEILYSAFKCLLCCFVGQQCRLAVALHYTEFLAIFSPPPEISMTQRRASFSLGRTPLDVRAYQNKVSRSWILTVGTGIIRLRLGSDGQFIHLYSPHSSATALAVAGACLCYCVVLQIPPRYLYLFFLLQPNAIAITMGVR